MGQSEMWKMLFVHSSGCILCSRDLSSIIMVPVMLVASSLQVVDRTVGISADAKCVILLVGSFLRADIPQRG